MIYSVWLYDNKLGLWQVSGQYVSTSLKFVNLPILGILFFFYFNDQFDVSTKLIEVFQVYLVNFQLITSLMSWTLQQKNVIKQNNPISVLLFFKNTNISNQKEETSKTVWNRKKRLEAKQLDNTRTIPRHASSQKLWNIYRFRNRVGRRWRVWLRVWTRLPIIQQFSFVAEYLYTG